MAASRADEEISRPRPGTMREWGLIAAATAVALPAPIIRVLEVTGAAHLGLEPLVESLIFGIGIFSAAGLLVWASEVAETEVSAALALVVLALIAVLPEYAVDLYFAIEAPHTPECTGIDPLVPPDCAGGVSDDEHPRNLAIANMTGANRLLVGLAWPVIFLIFFLRAKKAVMPIDRSNALGIAFLGLATLWSFTIPLRGHLSLIDTAVMFAFFGVYLFLSSRAPPEEHRVFVGPAAAIAALGKTPRRIAILAMFTFAAGVIFSAAEPFAEGLRDTGEDLGVSEFILIQWVAPLASETPEFLLAGILTLRGRHDAGMTILISSKVNQWTMLIGSLPLAYSISGETLDPLSFDTRQEEEVFLTAGQSLFAVAILVSLSMSRWEATLLAALFATQLFFTEGSVRVAFGALYCTLAVLMLARDVQGGGLPGFARAARDTALARDGPSEGKAKRRQKRP